MTKFAFRIVDVFAAIPFAGNPLAVVTTPEELDAGLMQRITRWLNFSETVFLLPPTDEGADYRVRIFTPARELPFAGHPTLGTCHAWLEAGGVPRDDKVVVQQCDAGLVRVRHGGEALAFAAPPTIRSGPVSDEELREIVEVLRISVEDVVSARWVDNGPGWVAVRLASAQTVLAVDAVRSYPKVIDIGVFGLHPAGHPSAYEIRAFFSDPLGGVVEDPVCGSLNASVAQWLVGEGVVSAPYQVSQGSRVQCDGRILIDQDGEGQIWVGGHTITRFSGTAEI
ncbi:MAG: PhzF family phenazine biosynthesis protein [Sphingobium sp.]